MHFEKPYRFNILLVILTGLIFTFSAKAQSFSPDGVGGYWLITGSKVIKVDSQGIQVATYSNLMLGKPTSVDASDPFRVLVFFVESQTLLILNSNATPIGDPLNLSSIGLGEISLTCRSARGGIWMFSHSNSEIILLDNRTLKIEQRIHLAGERANLLPNFMLEENGILYVGLNNKLIKRYDTYGAPLETLHINYNKEFRVANPFLITMIGGEVKLINLETPASQSDTISCQCSYIPVLIKDELMCFDGQVFIFCKKN